MLPSVELLDASYLAYWLVALCLVHVRCPLYELTSLTPAALGHSLGHTSGGKNFIVMTFSVGLEVGRAYYMPGHSTSGFASL